MGFVPFFTPRGFKPSPGAGIDRSNPINRGIVACIPFNVGSGEPRELISGNTVTRAGATWETSSFGEVLRVGLNQTPNTPTPAGLTLSKGSISFVYQQGPGGAAGGAARLFTTNSDTQFAVFRHTSDTELRFFITNTASFTVTENIFDGAHYRITFEWDQAASYRAIWIGRKKYTNATAFTAPAIDPTIYLGNRPDGLRPSHGHYEMYVLRSEYGDDIALAWADNPWQTFTPRRGTFFVPLGGSVDVTGSAAALTLTGNTGSIEAGVDVTGSAAALTLTGNTGSIEAGVDVTGSAAALTLTGNTGSIEAGVDVTGSAAALTLTGNTGSIEAGVDVTGSAAALTLTGNTGSIEAGVDVTGSAAALTLTGNTGSIEAGVDVTGSAAALTLTGNTGSIEVGGGVSVDVTGSTASLTLTGTSGSIEVGTDITGLSAVLGLNGQIGTVSAGLDLTGGSQALTLTGTSGSIEAGVGPVGLTGNLGLSGKTGSLNIGINITGASASLLLGGKTGKIVVGTFSILINRATQLITGLHADRNANTITSLHADRNANTITSLHADRTKHTL